MNLVGIRVVPHGFAKRGDRLAVVYICRSTDKTLLEELSDAVSGRLIQPPADQLAQRVGDGLCLRLTGFFPIRWP
jgi:hypothetical protein